MLSISKYIRDTAASIITNDTTGFNPTLAAICEDYGVQPFRLDFEKNTNFFQGWYGPKVLDESSNFRYPAAYLYTIKSQNQNLQKFATFSGAQMMGFDILLGFKKSSALPDTETLGDAVEASTYTMFNIASWGDVTFNGDVTVMRSPLAFGASNWLSLVRSTFSADYTTSV